MSLTEILTKRDPSSLTKLSSDEVVQQLLQGENVTRSFDRLDEFFQVQKAALGLACLGKHSTGLVCNKLFSNRSFLHDSLNSSRAVETYVKLQWSPKILGLKDVKHD